MRGLALFLVWLSLAPLAALAQTTAQEEEDKGYLTTLLQDALSGAGRNVDITGFSGALSSRATIERLTVADKTGIWLTLEDVVFDWNRSALLGGRLEVNELSAQRIAVPRLPVTEEGAPAPEATPIAIPELPVSVDIGKLSIARAELGRGVLGQEVVMSLSGKAKLADGGADISLATRRTDGKRGEIALSARYDPGDGSALIDLKMQEAEGGIAASALGLPGAPPVDLSLVGEGPIADFEADLRLATEGQDRLAGTITLSRAEGNDAPWQTRLDLGGDMTPLFAPELRDFFGTDIRLVAAAQRGEDGALTLDDLALDTRAMSVQGRFALGPDYWPRAARFTARIADPEGGMVTLPSPGGNTRIRRAVATLDYDAAQGDRWSGSLAVLDYTTPGGTAGALRLWGDGTLVPGDGGAVGKVTAALETRAEAMEFRDAALAQAVGEALSGQLNITYEEDAPVEITGIALDGADYALSGATTLDGLNSQLAAQLDLGLRAEALSRFGPLTGLALTGAAEVKVTGLVQLLSGAFNLEVEGTSRDLGLGIAQLDALLAGTGEVDIRASRDASGLTLERLSAQTRAARVAANGQIDSSGGVVDYEASVPDLSLPYPGGTGRLTASGQARLVANEIETVTLSARAAGNGAGGVALPFAGDLRLGNASLEALYDARGERSWQVNAVAAEARAAGFSARRLRLDGSGGLVQSEAGITAITGTLGLEGEGLGAEDAALARALGDSLSLDTRLRYAPDAPLTLEELSLVSGDARLRGTATLYQPFGTGAIETDLEIETGPLGRFSGLARQSLGGSAQLSLAAKLDEGATGFDVAANGSARDISVGNSLVAPLLAGTTRFDLAAARRDGGLIRLSRAEVENGNISITASGTEERIDVTTRLRDIGLLASDFSGPVSGGGTITLGDDSYGVDLSATGPGGTAVTTRGTISGSGRADLSITGDAPLGLANALLAPRRVNGRAALDLRLAGQLSPENLSGRISLSGGRAIDPELGLAVEDLAGAITLSGGQALLDIRGRSRDGGAVSIGGTVGLAAPNRADVTLALDQVVTRSAGLYETVIDARLAVVGPLSGGALISGRVDVGPTEIRVAASGVTAAGEIPDIDHVGTPAAVQATRARAGLTGGSAAGDDGRGEAGLYALDVLVSAPARIFVRGRGLDAELGGTLRLGGTTDDIQPSGAFELIRGRLDILGQRFELTEGEVQLTGSFDPDLLLVATTEAQDTTISITVSGRPSEPEVDFSSSPPMPEDEILSLLIFGRDLSKLSPLQALELANAVAVLAGRGGKGIMTRLREGFGLDDLDVTQSDDGNTAVRAGKYLSDNVYSDVVVESDGSSEVNLNLELTPNVTVKGSTDSDGNSGLGIFFEKDY